jgi:hypothetical protein
MTFGDFCPNYVQEFGLCRCLEIKLLCEIKVQIDKQKTSKDAIKEETLRFRSWPKTCLRAEANVYFLVSFYMLSQKMLVLIYANNFQMYNRKGF